MTDLSPNARRLRNDYLKGFAVAVVLTAIPFALAATETLGQTTTLLVIAVLGIVQILVHLVFFLHLDLRKVSDERIAVLAFTAVLIFLMVGGSLWIMFDLNARMM